MYVNIVENSEGISLEKKNMLAEPNLVLTKPESTYLAHPNSTQLYSACPNLAVQQNATFGIS